MRCSVKIVPNVRALRLGDRRTAWRGVAAGTLHPITMLKAGVDVICHYGKNSVAMLAGKGNVASIPHLHITN